MFIFKEMRHFIWNVGCFTHYVFVIHDVQKRAKRIHFSNSWLNVVDKGSYTLSFLKKRTTSAKSSSWLQASLAIILPIHFLIPLLLLQSHAASMSDSFPIPAVRSSWCEFSPNSVCIFLTMRPSKRCFTCFIRNIWDSQVFISSPWGVTSLSTSKSFGRVATFQPSDRLRITQAFPPRTIHQNTSRLLMGPV